MTFQVFFEPTSTYSKPQNADKKEAHIRRITSARPENAVAAIIKNPAHTSDTDSRRHITVIWVYADGTESGLRHVEFTKAHQARLEREIAIERMDANTIAE
ncbi:hypothetical protein BDW59DRAFT_167699 [Aspergillus cavernicola]|uniref:Uncharacterized protein n=1 Tax=Aspergillus cavernicola TaxID=176166 RepID=A0ABR4HBP6_9EURO